MTTRRSALAWIALGVATAMLTAGAASRLLPLTLAEVFAFGTGAACVLLVIDEQVWNFPVGIANNVFFFVVFWRSRLYGDMTLQVVYAVLGVMGWWRWSRVTMDRRPLRVTRAPVLERVLLIAIGAVATVLLAAHLRRIGGASPVLDSLTTILSLAAQWLLNGKRIDNWYVWIVADILYVGLYLDRRLYLTATLYAIFIAMCVTGLARWRRAAG
jgi:nicotinamide mononucleotide transporter